ncbi:hypothetical protein CLAFUW4_11703 [Fulvia fulva]|uniref:Uncharacterized protein n=1 Tax=Passalora fulva TaxID=5499 RepID=A0A9Q8US05_PASFU|nr:uncharacterized protein CLAFUR5_10748 [Fulvia fulva]KAK4619737.1 hypothetical protein CLAFUR4_11708 [Fulvia fulva]KAK4620279.1 hypothetical protein CLAFUR0_11721 [Fulvia fulva]UJO20288.1 hypothetical protein CLAFUR5_10748 [Fulvia fulva]WPV17500.1 hypothetical protein CLAFUW4_11703 [Fulvia fulva]WPV32345.1 hypothetical protein CLAFUW7_11711 [Fulvia fulva]
MASGLFITVETDLQSTDCHIPVPPFTHSHTAIRQRRFQAIPDALAFNPFEGFRGAGTAGQHDANDSNDSIRQEPYPY